MRAGGKSKKMITIILRIKKTLGFANINLNISIMKNTYYLSAFAMLALAIAISYLGLQRDHIFNPPIITGVGFLVLALVFIAAAKRE